MYDLEPPSLTARSVGRGTIGTSGSPALGELDVDDTAMTQLRPAVQPRSAIPRAPVPEPDFASLSRPVVSQTSDHFHPYRVGHSER